MAAGGKFTNDGVELFAERFLGVSSEGAPSFFAVGIGLTTPNVTDTQLEIPVPIGNGIVNDDGDNQMTGSAGGDNTTDNTTTFKPGAGLSDATAQNMITNTSSATKTWTISDLSSNGTIMTASSYWGLWLYIKDATEYAKFKSSGTAVEVKFGSDSSNYYSKTFTKSVLAIGWNFLTEAYGVLTDLSETGTVSGNIDTFIIEITTNNSSDDFSAGDVVYDLLRQWTNTELYKEYSSTFPSYNSGTKKITTEMILELTEANGFYLSEIILVNAEFTAETHDVFTPFSKSNTDKLKPNLKDLIDNS